MNIYIYIYIYSESTGRVLSVIQDSETEVQNRRTFELKPNLKP